MKKITFIIFLSFLLNGCSTPEINLKYQWLDYSEKTQEVKQGEISEKEYLNYMIKNLEIETPDFIHTAFPLIPDNYEGTKIPPGYYADIGTSYLKLGNPKKAIRFYKYEAKTWPESKVLMDKLIHIISRDIELYQKESK